MPLPHSGRWREHFAGVDLPVPIVGGGTVTGINFDNAASTPPLKRVRDAVTAFSEVYSSVHRGTGYKSRLATEAYEQARERVADFLAVDQRSQVVIFVKGTTESLPCRTRGESANRELALICSSDTGTARVFPALILTAGFLGSEMSTETTDAVPTALLRAPVS